MMKVLRLLRRTLLGVMLLLTVTSPALAEIGCIADASLHATLDGPLVFAGAETGIASAAPHDEPAGHSAACHLSHASHCQLLAGDRVAGAVTDRRSPALYWAAVTSSIDGRDPDGTIRPPRA